MTILHKCRTVDILNCSTIRHLLLFILPPFPHWICCSTVCPSFSYTSSRVSFFLSFLYLCLMHLNSCWCFSPICHQLCILHHFSVRFLLFHFNLNAGLLLQWLSDKLQNISTNKNRYTVIKICIWDNQQWENGRNTSGTASNWIWASIKAR